MTTTARRSARAALDAARAAIARLDDDGGPEDQAADLIEAWSGVETALRSLVGGSALTGQALIREARQRQVINFDQANALADFQATRDRLESHDYRPTEDDITAARTAFSRLDTSLLSGVSTDPAAAPTVPSAAATLPPPAAATAEPVPTSGRGVPVWAALLVAVIAVAVIGGAGYYAFGGRNTSTSLEKGIQYYSSGQREAAVGEFNKAVREDPKAALPHIYLARMAREVGNFTMASQELQLALTAEPTNALALREMGANLLAQGNYDLARRFYVRAVEADPTDKNAQGYLGCTLMRLGRTPEAQNFLNRAGPGPWSNCPPAVPTQPGMQGGVPVQPGPVVPRPVP